MRLMQLFTLLILSTSIIANDYETLQKKYNTLEQKYVQLEERLKKLENLLITSNPPKKYDSAAPKKKTVKTAGIMQVGANELSREYKKNSVATELKYSKAPLIVSGEIFRIDRSLMGEVYVTLKTTAFTPICCYFSESQLEEIASLEKGQQVRIKGRYVTSLLGVDIKESMLLD